MLLTDFLKKRIDFNAPEEQLVFTKATSLLPLEDEEDSDDNDDLARFHVKLPNPFEPAVEEEAENEFLGFGHQVRKDDATSNQLDDKTNVVTAQVIRPDPRLFLRSESRGSLFLGDGIGLEIGQQKRKIEKLLTFEKVPVPF